MSYIAQIQAEQTWPIRHQVMYPGREIELAQLSNDQEGIHWGLFENNQLLSVISIFATLNDVQFRKFATLESQQGKGHGSRLLQHIIEQAITQHCKRIWCNARKSAEGFYKKFGFESTGEYYMKNGIEYVTMERKLK